MLSLVTLDDQNGNPVTLHQDATTGKRWLTEAHGLRGVQGLRINHRVRSQAHGGINETKFEQGRQITLVGEIMSQVSIEDAFNEWALVAGPMAATLDGQAALLKWTEGAGVLNLILNPSFEYDAAGSQTAAGWSTSNGPGMNSFGTLQIVSSQHQTGAQSCQVNAAGSAGQGICSSSLGAVSQGVAYTFSVWMKGNAGGEQIVIEMSNAAETDFARTTVTLSTAWQRFSITWTPSANETAGYALVRTAATSTVTYFVDGAQVAQSASVGTYFDGDSSGAEWAGVTGDSASRMGHALQRLVKLDGDLDPPFQEAEATLSYQAQFFAEDPRAYSQTLQTITGTPLAQSGGGHTFNTTYPRTYAASGGGTLAFTNYGNRPTPLKFQIYGYAVNPRIFVVGTSTKLSFVGTVNAGDYLEVDCAKRTVKLNGTTNRLNFLDAANSTWSDAPAGLTNYQLIADSFDGSAQLVAIGRSAYA